MMPVSFQGVRAALAIAHPVHELRIHGWLETAHPTVFILTDGSGRYGQSRLGSTTRILAQAGAHPGSIYGRLTDRMLYAAILHHDFELFSGLADELAEALVREKIEYVVGDAAEGTILAHDVWRLVIGAAIETAHRTSGRRIANFDFFLNGQPDPYQGAPPPEAIWLQLDEDALRRKLRAASNYRELKDFVEGTIRERGIETFRVECLRPVDNRSAYDSPGERSPYYEWWGEQQVAIGNYEQVIRYSEHVAPLAEALWRHVTTSRR